MANPIVVLNVSQNVPPTPSTLQQTGAILSQGATTLTEGTFSLLTQPASLPSLLTPAAALSSLTWAGGTVTADTVNPLPAGYTTGMNFQVTIAGAAPAGYNVTATATVTGAGSFTFPLANNAGSETAPGTWIPASVATLQNKAASFFGQGGVQPVYVLELGPGNAVNGIPALTSFLLNTPSFFYAYLFPLEWDVAAAPAAPGLTANTSGGSLGSETVYVKTAYVSYGVPGVASAEASIAVTGPSGQVVVTSPPAVAGSAYYNVYAATTSGSEVLQNAVPIALGTNYDINTLASGTAAPGNPVLNFVENYEALDAMVYFVVTTSSINYVNYTAQMKCVEWFVPSPTAASTEFGAAALLYNILVNRPGPGNRMPPMEYRFVFGVTPWPAQGYAATTAKLLAADGNIVLTGAEGGISNAVLYGGTAADGNDFLYWYSADWIQINLNLNLSNTIINGSNTTINPLYISQDGINRLQNAAIQTLTNAVQFGLATGQVVRAQLDSVTFAANLDNGDYDGMIVCNAVPYQTYYSENPGDYKARKYNGLQVIYVPSAGFDSIQVQLVLSQFAATQGIGF